ncbi:MAG: nucleotidyltransferase family protein [Armatimonadota bacterium]
MPLQIEVPLEKIARYCRENNIARLRAFGSVLRDDFGPESDVDLLVTFEPEAGISLLDHVRIQRELSALLGRTVDLVSEKGISKYIRDEVLEEAESLYVSPRSARKTETHA